MIEAFEQTGELEEHERQPAIFVLGIGCAAAGKRHPRPIRIFKVVRYCVVNVLSRPYLLPMVLVPTMRK